IFLDSRCLGRIRSHHNRLSDKLQKNEVFSLGCGHRASSRSASDLRRAAKVIMSDCTGNGNCNDCTGDSVSCGNVDGGSVEVSTADGGDGLADWANVLIALAGVIVAILALIGVKCACDRRRDRSRTGSGGSATGQ
ncbi:unnamed protein product, partial [Ectocarpus sp. 12 AP-2014]